MLRYFEVLRFQYACILVERRSYGFLYTGIGAGWGRHRARATTRLSRGQRQRGGTVGRDARHARSALGDAALPASAQPVYFFIFIARSTALCQLYCIYA